MEESRHTVSFSSSGRSDVVDIDDFSPESDDEGLVIEELCIGI